MLRTINLRISEITPQIISWRRHLHQHPELSGQEKETAAMVAEILDSNDIHYQSGVGGHGVVAWLDNGRPEPGLAFRADMDALPLTEAKPKDCPYTSTHQGVMHACGHDGHTAVLLGLATVLAPIAHQLPRPVTLIFQPAEENGQGARAMLAEQVLQNPPTMAIFGFHFFPHLETGTVALSQGPIMAATNHFSLEVFGTSSHACYPEKSIDAIQIAVSLITSINYLMTKARNQVDPALISIGTINGGTASNIIASQVKITGTIRTLFPEQRQNLLKKFKDLLEDLAKAYGARISLKIDQVAPALTNDPRLVQHMARLLGNIPEIKELDLASKPVLGGEDFAYFAQQVPGCYLKIGCGNQKKGIIYPLHSNRFDLDEDALELATKVLAATACQPLELSDSEK
ncbi:MAG: amidohydrolase [Deltaproteobacteria bacterium]|nr:amidohydrolase [Candidatus Tharpellaceae bacterium]